MIAGIDLISELYLRIIDESDVLPRHDQVLGLAHQTSIGQLVELFFLSSQMRDTDSYLLVLLLQQLLGVLDRFVADKDCVHLRTIGVSLT